MLILNSTNDSLLLVDLMTPMEMKVFRLRHNVVHWIS